MKQIRESIFETNSSSCHSLTLCSIEEFRKWEKGELLFNESINKFVENKDDHKQKLIKSALDCGYIDTSDEFDYLIKFRFENSIAKFINALYYEYNIDIDSVTWEEFKREAYDRGFEVFSQTATIDGKSIAAFGYYGHD